MKTHPALTIYVPLVAALAQFLAPAAWGHGTMVSPKSRVRIVYEGLSQIPRAPWVVQAVAADGENSYYTWNQLSRNFVAAQDGNNIAPYTAAGGVPDGQLPSAGNNPLTKNMEGHPGLSFSGLDAVSNDWEWPATTVSAGPLQCTFQATAIHDPSSFHVWITKSSYNHRVPLNWSDLEYLGKAAQTKDGMLYNLTVNLPARTGHHILYVGWQRIDPAGEVFFSTSDLQFGGSTGGGTPVVSVSPATMNVNESAGNAVVNVTLSAAAPSSGVTVNYTTAAGTAGASDFTAKSGTLTFASGETQKQVTIPVANDTQQESDEIFSLNLSGPNGATAGTMSSSITIKDDDAPASTGSGFTFNVYDNWGTGWRANLDLTNGSGAAWNNWTLEFDAPWTINGSVSNGVLVSHIGNHYVITPQSWNASIPAGAVLNIEFGTNGTDTTPPTNIKINGQAVTGLIPGVFVDSVSVPEGDTNGTISMAIKLESAHTAPIHVSYATVAGTAVAGTDYTNTTGSVIFAAGETSKSISIPFAGNTVQQPDRSFNLSLAGVSGQTPPRFVTGKQAATVTIMDDDGGPVLLMTGDSLIEGNSGTKNAVFRFKLSRAPKAGEVISVNYATANETASAGTDYTAASGKLTFSSATATINVPVSGDTTDETLELFQMNLSAPAGCAPRNTSAACQIIDDDTLANAYGNQRIVAYLDVTGNPVALPDAHRVTHLMAAFANVNADGTLAAPEIPASWHALKTQNPSLKILLSVGGWSWSAPFTQVANDPVKATAFANSCKLTVQNSNIDGIDIDWEWPGGGNTSPLSTDKANFTALVHKVRLALNSLSATTGKQYEITCYAPALQSLIDYWDLAALKNDFNFFNVQGYDLHGTWELTTAHQSAIHKNPSGPANDKLDIENVLKIYQDAGVPKSQLLVGAPFYGQRWSNAGAAQNGLFQSATGIDQLTYADIMNGPAKDYLRTWDSYAKVPWLYDAMGSGKTFIAFDDPQAIHEKALYSRAQGYSGVFFWQLGGDTTDRQLLTTLSDTMASVPVANGDTDGDSIPDAWEQENFSNLTTANATSDYDGDSASDYFEYLSRTNPKDRTSILRPGIHGAGTAQPMVEFNSVQGVSYRIERSFDLSAWTSIGTVVGTGGHYHHTDTTLPANSKRAFYRIIPLP